MVLLRFSFLNKRAAWTNLAQRDNEANDLMFRRLPLTKSGL